jgi:hypothetical protein
MAVKFVDTADDITGELRAAASIGVRHVHNCIEPAGDSQKKNNQGCAVERRLTTRHRARTVVYLLLPGNKRRLCRAKNLSASGVFVETNDMGLRRGQTVQLAFAINLGVVTKIHRRTAVVAHISRGGTGLMMEGHGT